MAKIGTTVHTKVFFLGLIWQKATTKTDEREREREPQPKTKLGDGEQQLMGVLRVYFKGYCLGYKIDIIGFSIRNIYYSE